MVSTSGEDCGGLSRNTASPAIGVVLDGKYRLLSRLGAGGMSVVYRAENVHTGKLVALKWLRPGVHSEHGATARLLREARAASSLRHPGVVDVYDVGRSGSAHFLVMELLEGETLRGFLRRTPAPTVVELLSRLRSVLDGVVAAHAHGIVHRDLKPENIFIERIADTELERGKVLDFGIAKLQQEAALAETLTGTAVGTPAYMSLEQLRGDRDVDARADVYALGAILYEALAGRLPHEASSLPELAIKVATVTPAPLASLRPDLPPALTSIIDWALAREREQRLPCVLTLRDELELFARESDFRKQMADPHAALPRLPDPLERRAHAGRAESAPFHVLPAAQSGSAVSKGPGARSRKRAILGFAAAAAVLCALAVATARTTPPRAAAELAVLEATAVQVQHAIPAEEHAAISSGPSSLPVALPPAADSCPSPQPPPARSAPARRPLEVAKRSAAPEVRTLDAPAPAPAEDAKPRLKRADIAQLLAF